MEELKLILETISKISGDASTVAIWWVALHYSTKILTSIIVFGGVAVIVYIIAKAFQNTSEWSNLAKSIVRLMAVVVVIASFMRMKRQPRKLLRRQSNETQPLHHSAHSQ